MLSSADAITQCCAKAILIARAALYSAQADNDTMMAFQALRRAYNVKVAPILAMSNGRGRRPRRAGFLSRKPVA